MAYGFRDNKSKRDVVTYPSIINNSGSGSFTLSSNVFQKTLTKTKGDGFYFITFDKLPQGVTGTVSVYLDDSGHRIAIVPLNSYTKTIMGYVPVKEGSTLYLKLNSNTDTATLYVSIDDVI